MKRFGTLTIWDEKCSYSVQDNDVYLIPIDDNLIKKFRKHYNDKNFLLVWEECFETNYLYVKRIEYSIDGTIKLYPKYTINKHSDTKINGFELTGEIIDDFFNPVRYFYDKRNDKTINLVNYLYDSDVADNWKINVENKEINIELIYGDLLNKGIFSDLMLHPRLRIKFEQTVDVEYIYKIYLIFVRFFKLITYNKSIGNINVNLFSEKNSYIGNMIDFTYTYQYIKEYRDLHYIVFKQYIQNYLQFASCNDNYSFNHFPVNQIRFFGRDYTQNDFINIFSAFEEECKMESEIYLNVDIKKIKKVKSDFLAFIDNYSKLNLENEEIKFIEDARNRISQLGTQFGQKRKIINAYNILSSILCNSIENIFYLPEFRLKGPISDDDIEEIALKLSSKRGMVAHESNSNSFSDIDAQKIRFLEIIVYCQLLKRMGLKEDDVERVIGVIFSCNYIVFNELCNK